MDAETERRFAALEAELAALRAQLVERRGKTAIGLKQAAYEGGCSVETMRRRALKDPAWQIHNGRWTRSA